MAQRSVDELLDEARRSLQRVDPAEAARAAEAGALIIDIRPSELRHRDGLIPDALVIDRNVLEWRLDPASANRVPEVTSYEQTIILVCDEGYASSLAAATLQRLGLHRATDLTGGIQAWIADGFPTVPTVPAGEVQTGEVQTD
jgi:rhodanese-related sulfurtransferase